MGSRIEWVTESCRLLSGIGDEFDSTRPFADKRIGTGIHLEPKTVALLLTLRRGGAEVISTGNLGTTQLEAVEYLRANGVEVVGGPTTDSAEHDGDLARFWPVSPISSSTTAATSLSAISSPPTSISWAEPRRRPRAAVGSARFETRSAGRCS